MFKKIKGKTLITGFHGIGMVGFIAIDYLIKKLGAKKIGWIHKEYLPCVVFSTKKRLEMPIEFYEFEDAVFMKINLVLEKKVLGKFLKELFIEINKNKPKKILIVGGLATNERNIYGVTNTFGTPLLKELKLKHFPKDITVFGPMAGTLIESERLKIPSVCILPNASPNLPDPEAASRAITKLSKYLNFKINVSDLKKEAKKIEKRMNEMKAKTEVKDELSERMFV